MMVTRESEREGRCRGERSAVIRTKSSSLDEISILLSNLKLLGLLFVVSARMSPFKKAKKHY
jgi:hypothetical protein